MSASPARMGAISRGISLARVLVVGVGVDDDVGAQAQRGVEAGHEAGGQALAAREAHDVVGAVRARHLGRASRVEPSSMTSTSTSSTPGDVAGDRAERLGQRGLFVEAGDLDDQLHSAGTVAHAAM